MKFYLTVLSIWRIALAAIFLTVGTLSVSSVAVAQDAAPTLIKTIQVQGNQRIEANTVASYLLFAPGDPYSETRLDTSIKTLYSTGLFADCLLYTSPSPRDS